MSDHSAMPRRCSMVMVMIVDRRRRSSFQFILAPATDRYQPPVFSAIRPLLRFIGPPVSPAVSRQFIAFISIWRIPMPEHFVGQQAKSNDEDDDDHDDNGAADSRCSVTAPYLLPILMLL